MRWRAVSIWINLSLQFIDLTSSFLSKYSTHPVQGCVLDVGAGNVLTRSIFHATQSLLQVSVTERRAISWYFLHIFAALCLAGNVGCIRHTTPCKYDLGQSNFKASVRIYILVTQLWLIRQYLRQKYQWWLPTAARGAVQPMFLLHNNRTLFVYRQPFQDNRGAQKLLIIKNLILQQYIVQWIRNNKLIITRNCPCNYSKPIITIHS